MLGCQDATSESAPAEAAASPDKGGRKAPSGEATAPQADEPDCDAAEQSLQQCKAVAMAAAGEAESDGDDGDGQAEGDQGLRDAQTACLTELVPSFVCLFGLLQEGTFSALAAMRL